MVRRCIQPTPARIASPTSPCDPPIPTSAPSSAKITISGTPSSQPIQVERIQRPSVMDEVWFTRNSLCDVGTRFAAACGRLLNAEDRVWTRQGPARTMARRDRSASDGGVSAVDQVIRSGDERRLLGEQERDHAGYLLGPAESPQRVPGDQLGAIVV